MFTKISKYIYDCDKCPVRCDGKSKNSYIFENDVKFAEQQEQIIIDKLRKKGYQADKCTKEGYPDIEITKNNKITNYLEIKAQRRTFMSVKHFLPKANLQASETIALNLSDLLRYFKIYKKENIPILIIWVLQNRPCIVPDNKRYYFYQSIEILADLYNKYKNNRTFHRKSGKGDVVDGVHKGVVVNYHFSLNELKMFKL